MHTSGINYQILFRKPLLDLFDVCRMGYGVTGEDSGKMAQLELIRRAMIMKEIGKQFPTNEMYHFAMAVLIENHIPTHDFNHLDPNFGA